MCTGGCARCLGGTLIPLAVFGLLANILLFFPGGKVVNDKSHLSDEVWYFGGILGSGVLMIFPALVFLGLQNNDCCGCCGNEGCGKRFAMFTSTLFAVIGFLGAGYSFIVSAVSINKGPKCFMANGTWGYPFHDGKNMESSGLLLSGEHFCYCFHQPHPCSVATDFCGVLLCKKHCLPKGCVKNKG